MLIGRVIDHELGDDAHQLLFGAIIVAVVLLMPRGILGVLQQKYNLPRTI